MRYIQVEGGSNEGAENDMSGTCDMCGKKACKEIVDGATRVGSWANMCKACHKVYGRGLGVGKGQLYRLAPQSEMGMDESGIYEDYNLNEAEDDESDTSEAGGDEGFTPQVARDIERGVTSKKKAKKGAADVKVDLSDLDIGTFDAKWGSRTTNIDTNNPVQVLQSINAPPFKDQSRLLLVLDASKVKAEIAYEKESSESTSIVDRPPSSVMVVRPKKRNEKGKVVYPQYSADYYDVALRGSKLYTSDDSDVSPLGRAEKAWLDPLQDKIAMWRAAQEKKLRETDPQFAAAHAEYMMPEEEEAEVEAEPKKRKKRETKADSETVESWVEKVWHPHIEEIDNMIMSAWEKCTPEEKEKIKDTVERKQGVRRDNPEEWSIQTVKQLVRTKLGEQSYQRLLKLLSDTPQAPPEIGRKLAGTRETDEGIKALGGEMGKGLESIKQAIERGEATWEDFPQWASLEGERETQERDEDSPRIASPAGPGSKGGIMRIQRESIEEGSFSQGGITIPDYIKDSLDRYIQHGIKPGSALTAILSDSLRDTIARADETLLASLEQIIIYLENEVPADCWGSEEIVKSWIRKGGLSSKETAQDAAISEAIAKIFKESIDSEESDE